MTTGRVNTLSIDDILTAAPPLRAIIARAAAKRCAPYRERLGEYERAKSEAASLVGFGSAVPELQSSRAWEVLIGTLSDVLNI